MKKQIRHRAPGAGRKPLDVERHTITLLTEHADKLRAISPNLSHAIRRVIREAPQWLWCKHPRLELRNNTPPESKYLFFFSESYLICLDCNTRPMCTPSDVKTIVNIPHPPQSECDHPAHNCTWSIAVGGGRTCLQCGDHWIESPSCKLEIS